MGQTERDEERLSRDYSSMVKIIGDTYIEGGMVKTFDDVDKALNYEEWFSRNLGDFQSVVSTFETSGGREKFIGERTNDVSKYLFTDSRVKRIDGPEELKIQELEKKVIHFSEELKKMNIVLTTQGKKIQNLETENIELRKELDELKKGDSIDLLEKKYAEHNERYEEHFVKFHLNTYTISNCTISPDLLKKTNGNLYCFESEKYHFILDFDITSGPDFDEKEKSINFEGLKMLFNNEPVEDLRIGARSVAFDVTFSKLGRSELTCSFQNITQEQFLSVVQVEPSTLCVERSPLELILGSIEPTGEVLSVSDHCQSTDIFSSDDVTQVALTLLNENEVPILFKHICDEEFEFNCSLISLVEGKKKRIKKVLSRNAEIEIQEGDLKPNGEFIVCTIGEKVKLQPGTYVVSVTDVDNGISKKKKFMIQ